MLVGGGSSADRVYLGTSKVRKKYGDGSPLYRGVFTYFFGVFGQIESFTVTINILNTHHIGAFIYNRVDTQMG